MLAGSCEDGVWSGTDHPTPAHRRAECPGRLGGVPIARYAVVPYCTRYPEAWPTDRRASGPSQRRIPYSRTTAAGAVVFPLHWFPERSIRRRFCPSRSRRVTHPCRCSPVFTNSNAGSHLPFVTNGACGNSTRNRMMHPRRDAGERERGRFREIEVQRLWARRPLS